MAQDNTLLMEGVKIIFRNFAGKATPFAPAGDHKFSVRLDADVYEQLKEDGWPVKMRLPKDEEGDIWYHLPVSLKYRNREGKTVRPPRVVMISSRGRTSLGEDELELLDFANIANVDLIVRPFVWGPINGKTGTKAYLQSIFVTIEEDALELKYSDLDEVPAPAGMSYEG